MLRPKWTVHAILPVKGLEAAKARLAEVLSPWGRKQLVLAMLADTLEAALAAGLAKVSVLSPDARVLALAEHAGATPIYDVTGALSLNHALERAVEDCCAGADAVVLLLADVPMATPAELASVVETGFRMAVSDGGTGRSVVIAQDHAGRGTNALFLRPPTAIPLRFGPDSLSLHVVEAVSRGIPHQICRLPGLSMDLDTAADLQAFIGTPGNTRTHRLLGLLELAGHLSEELRPSRVAGSMRRGKD